jgi:hypothetical protein
MRNGIRSKTIAVKYYQIQHRKYECILLFSLNEKIWKIPSYVTNTYIYKKYSCEIYGISLYVKLNLNFPRI